MHMYAYGPESSTVLFLHCSVQYFGLVYNLDSQRDYLRQCIIRKPHLSIAGL